MSAPKTSSAELLKISELAERSGVPVATIRHYLREGLLPEPVKTSRNMAYYPPEFVDRIRLIKQLQEERFMPLRVIRELLEREDAEPERLRAMIDLEDRILERALAGERERVPSDEVRDRYDVPKRGAGPARGARRPEPRTGSATRRRTCGSSRRSPASGPAATTSGSGSPSTTPCATSRRSSRSWPRRWTCSLSVSRATSTRTGRIEIVEAGVGPLNDLMAALHTKLLVAELERQRTRRG